MLAEKLLRAYIFVMIHFALKANHERLLPVFGTMKTYNPVVKGSRSNFVHVQKDNLIGPSL